VRVQYLGGRCASPGPRKVGLRLQSRPAILGDSSPNYSDLEKGKCTPRMKSNKKRDKKDLQTCMVTFWVLTLAWLLSVRGVIFISSSDYFQLFLLGLISITTFTASVHTHIYREIYQHVPFQRRKKTLKQTLENLYTHVPTIVHRYIGKVPLIWCRL